MIAQNLPRVDYFALGGTIASVRTGDGTGAIPTLTADDIVAGVEGVDRIADVHTHQFLLKPSPQISFADILQLRDQVAEAVAAGAAGAVVTQGTDSIEETAFVMDLLWSDDLPVVFSGSMRNPSLPGSEGAANLLGAVQVAISEPARGTGVLVTLNDEIHAARYVHKAHTSSPSSFGSPGLGPIGWISEGRPVIPLRPSGRFTIDLRSGTPMPPVALIRLGLGDDCRILSTLPGLGFAGVVVEAFGGGHVPVEAMPLLEKIVAEVPVVLASRTGAGEVLWDTYRFPGSEIELMNIGLIRAGALDGLKARLLLSVCLGAGYDRAGLAHAYRIVGTTNGPVIHE